jgi:TonB-linked SusC/RagA family outer membrane protein
MQSRAHFTLASRMDIQKAGWSLSSQMLLNKKRTWIQQSFHFIFRKQNWLVMKLTAILLLSACLQISAKGFSQDVTLSEKNVSLQKIFNQIHKQTGYQFFYEDEMLNKAGRINIKVTDMPLEKVLAICFKDLPLSYSFVNNVITLKRKTGDLVQTIEAPTFINIKGTVKDDQGHALAGVSVIVKGTKRGTSTDAEGSFSINANVGDVLEFSFVGYKNKNVTLGNSNTLSVVMEIEATLGNEVVVVGYGTQKKALVTGAVSTVKMDAILGDRPVSTTSSLLQGAVPGLQVTISSGIPGASASLNIRGGTDFGSSTTSGINTSGPFIVLDNVPFNGPLNMIDPNDIESVSLLKDAGSAAIYGARSAFGVLLITTKKGNKNQKVQFNYSNNISFASPLALPQRATPTQMVQSWIDGYYSGSYWGAQNLQTWIQLLGDYKSNPSTYPGGYAVNSGIYYQLAPVDPVKDLLGNTGFQQMHNFSINGGSDKTTYRISFGTTNEKGILVPAAHQDAYKRYNVKSIISTDINKWMTAQLDASYYYSLNTSPFYTSAFGNATNQPNVLPLDSLPSGVGLSSSGLVASGKNQMLATAPTTNRNDDIRMTARTIFKPLKGLTITGEYTFDNLRNITTTYDKQINGLLSVYNLQLTPLGSGLYTINNAATDYNSINIYGSYTKSFKSHNFSLLGGYNQEQGNYQQGIMSANGMYDANNPAIATATGSITATDNYVQYANRGWFGRFNYDYKAKYLLELNGRYDGSSKFPSGKQYGFFPSVSLGWRVTEEKFMQKLKPWLNELKLRGSVGTVGNQSIPDYSYYASLYAYNPYWLVGGQPILSLTAPSLISSDFTWETVKTTDFGFNFGLLNNRLTGSYDWYQRETKNILTAAASPLPAVLGTGAPLQNSGALKTTGFELQLNWKDKIGKFTYYIGANLYDYQSIVTNAVNPNKVISQLYVGQHLGDIWGYVTDRLYTTNDFTAPGVGWQSTNYQGGVLNPGIAKFSGASPNPGDMLYKKYDTTSQYLSIGANTVASPGDRKIIGNSSPRYQYGINGGVAYKNFDFSFVISGVAKRQLWLNNALIFPNDYQTYSQLYANELNYWTPTNTNAFFGRLYQTPGSQQANNQTVQTRYLQNGAYLRISNLTLRYSLPENIIQKASFKKLQIFCSVENPFMFDHLPKGVFPDIAIQGGANGGGQGYPFLRKTSVGLNLSF